MFTHEVNLNWLSDRFLRRDVAKGGGPLVGLSFIGVHRLGFQRGYATGVLTVAVVFGALRLLGVA